MDYKHRVPGNRPRRSRRPDRIGLVVGVMVTVTALGVVAWLTTGSDEEGDAPLPEQPRMTQMPAPSPNLAEKPRAANQGDGEAKEPAATSAPARSAQASSSPSPKPKPPEPRFSFYKILPEKEVIIAESEIKTIKREENEGRKPDGSVYMIQTGSFTRLDDAEKFKARLSELKVKARIESVKIENTEWHRVKIGPFDSLVNADRVRAYLRANQIDSVVQKAKAG